MSGYATGEADLLTLIRLMDEFDEFNSSRGNWHMLNSGRATYYAILRPMPYTVQKMSIAGLGDNYTEHTTWSTMIEVWHRYKNDGTSAIALQGVIDLVKAHMAKYRHGNSSSTIFNLQVTGGDEMVQAPADAPQWLMWSVICEWQQETQVSGAE